VGHDQQSGPGEYAGGSGWGGGVPDLVTALELIGRGTVSALGASITALSMTEERDLMAAMVAAQTVTEARRTGWAFLTQKMNYAAGGAAADVAAARQLDPAGAGFDPGLLAETDPDAGVDLGAGGTGGDDPDGVHAAAADMTSDSTGPGAAFGTTTGLGTGLGAPGLPRMGAALAAGLVTRAHVDVAVRCLARVPEHLANRVDAHGVSGRVKIDVFLTRTSREHSPTTTDRIAKELLAALDPDGLPRNQIRCLQCETAFDVAQATICRRSRWAADQRAGSAASTPAEVLAIRFGRRVDMWFAAPDPGLISSEPTLRTAAEATCHGQARGPSADRP
jgi:hypothetical protein